MPPSNGHVRTAPLSLRYAIRETRRANEWASKEWPHNTKWFDLNDDWIGMEQRGIKREKIEEACIKHQENEEVSKIINDQRESAKAAYSYSPSEAINIYEKLKRANAPLKYLSERLEAGIPAKGKPTRIHGRDIIGTSGDDNNCLIHSLMEVSKPKELMDLEEKMKKGGKKKETSLMHTVSSQSSHQIISHEKYDTISLMCQQTGSQRQNEGEQSAHCFLFGKRY